VVASDGAQSAHAESAPFQVAAKPPVVIIKNPANNLHIQWGQLVNFASDVRDPQEQALLDANLTWSNAYRVLGHGPAVAVTDLEVGTNVVTLSAKNAAGLTGMATVTVVVGDQLALPGPRLSASPSPIGWQVAGDATALQTANLNVSNVGGGSLSFTATSTQPWLKLNGSAAVSSTAPVTLAVTADPSALPDTKLSSAAIQLTNASDAGDVLLVPVSLAKGDVVGGHAVQDTDGDGVSDASDNCILVANADQRDTDGDGYGNACDPDFNNDGVVNAVDLARLKQVFFKSDELVDLNGDGVVNAVDLARLKSFFFQKPGPSAKAP
jgi:hypothetical protein